MFLFSLLVGSPRRRLWNGRINLWWLVAWLVVMIGGHVVAMQRLEGLSLSDALWVTMATITTIGYGDVSAKTDAGRFATVLFLVVGGIFVLTSAINSWLERRRVEHDRKRRGDWRWKLRDHVVFISPRTGQHEDFIEKVVSELRVEGDWTPALLVSVGEADGVRGRFEDLNLAVVRRGEVDGVALTNASADHAVLVVILDDPGSQSASFAVDALTLVRDVNPTCRVIVETEAHHSQRVLRLGANATLRPLPGYPEMLAREILDPGTAEVSEDLLGAHGSTLVRFNLRERTAEHPWSYVVQMAMEHANATPIAYVNGDGVTICHPAPSDPVVASALFVVTRDDRAESQGRIAALSRMLAPERHALTFNAEPAPTLI